MLTLEVCADVVDEYYKARKSIIIECMKRFCKMVRNEFDSYDLKQPRRVGFDKQLEINVTCGFPKIFVSLDCMHYEVKLFDDLIG